jgi:hypothetical protein
MGSLRGLGRLVLEALSGDLDIAVRGPRAARPWSQPRTLYIWRCRSEHSAGSAMLAELIPNKPQRHIQCDHVAFVSRVILQQTSAD